jgi:hypothetical protein
MPPTKRYPEGLSVENLYALSADQVVPKVQRTFLTMLRLAPAVNGTFFPSDPTPMPGPSPERDATDWLNSVAWSLACSGISRTSEHGFSRVVDRGKADKYLNDELDSKTALNMGQALYDWLFPDYCIGSAGTTFNAYLNGVPPEGSRRGVWAAHLASHVTTDQFINVVVAKLIASQPNWLDQVNLVYYKVHRLNPGENKVVQAWTARYPKAVEQWQTNNYLKAALSADTWTTQAVARISEATTTTTHSPNPYGAPVDTTRTCYGEAVQDFLSGIPARMGLRTGTNMNNCH